MRRRTACLVVIFSAAATGCGSKPPRHADLFPTAETPRSSRATSFKGAVYVDGTVSMKGFVLAGPSTGYDHFIRALERVFSNPPFGILPSGTKLSK